MFPACANHSADNATADQLPLLIRRHIEDHLLEIVCGHGLEFEGSIWHRWHPPKYKGDCGLLVEKFNAAWMSMTVSVEKKGPVTTVILSRPEAKNAVDPATAAELVRAFEAFEADAGARAGVFFGDNGTFCAGADLKAFVAGDWRGWVRADAATAPMGPSRMFLSKPVIAAVAGHAVAGGLELALWCDLRVMEEDAVFGVFCRRWGVPLIDGGTVRLPRLVGHGRALDMILTGRPVKADEAMAWGLANRVVPKGEARAAAEALAAEIAAFPPACVKSDRLSAYEQWDLPLQDALRNELRRGFATIESGETAAGISRFVSGAGRHGRF
jgi:enoyl-CoA hydratase